VYYSYPPILLEQEELMRKSLKPRAGGWMLALLIMAAVLLAACVPAAAPQATAPEAGAVTPIRVLTMQQAGPTPEEMDAIAAEFNAAHPEAKVELTYVAYDALHDKIVTSVSGDNPAYDVVLVDDIWFAQFADAGWLLDATDRVDETTKNEIFPAAWEISTVGGKIYGMPWLLDQKYFFYNTEILAAAGFDAPPTTWEELTAMGKVMVEKGLVDYPTTWSWAQAEAAICDYVTLVFGNGGELFDVDAKPVFNQGKGVEALTWMVNSIADGTSNPASISSVEEDVRNVFSQGKAAFASNWVYMYDMAQNNADESLITGKVGMALMPAFQAAKDAGTASATIDGSMGFAVVDKSPNKDLAWEYVKYLTSKPVQTKYSAHLLPMWQTAYADGPELDALLAINPSNPVTVPMFKEQFPFSHVRPKVPYYTEASLAMQIAIQEALSGSKTPQEALDDAAAKIVEMQTK